MHSRMELACAAATAAGVPGRFEVSRGTDTFTVLATNPALSFLSVTVVSAESEKAPAGLVRVADRGLAVRALDDSVAEPRVIEVNSAEFLPVLLAGYEVDGTVADFISAEHRLPEVRRFLAMRGETPIAGAAMTIHGDVAVLGGAATVRAYRGRGGQSSLLRHRLHIAAQAGCTVAAATVVPGSVSAANLVRAGFAVYRRSAWQRSIDCRT